MKVETAQEHSTPYMGVSEHIFLIIGMSNELKNKICSEALRRQFKSLLPPTASIIPYDVLRLAFERTFFPSDKLIVSEDMRKVIENTSWETSMTVCLEYVKKAAGPDSPTADDIARALKRRGQRSDIAYVLTIVNYLVAEGALAETDSLFPPWDTLYWIPRK